MDLMQSLSFVTTHPARPDLYLTLKAKAKNHNFSPHSGVNRPSATWKTVARLQGCDSPAPQLKKEVEGQ